MNIKDTIGRQLIHEELLLPLLSICETQEKKKGIYQNLIYTS